MERREEFNKNDILKLWQRVGGKCSNPSCRKETIGPNIDPNKGVLIGEAAHIIGACANSGPRHDSTLGPGERGRIENGIWLCKNCARLIDVNEKAYPVELLRKWKADAEYEQFCILEGKNPTYDIRLIQKQKALQKLSSVVNELHNIFLYTLEYYNNNFNGLGKYDVQNEIDDRRYLHESAIKCINEYQVDLNDLFDLYKNKGLNYSETLNNLIIQYRDCFCFSFEDDGGLGLTSDFWGSLFVCFKDNKSVEKETYNKITKQIKTEY